MKLSYRAKCTVCGNERDVSILKRKIRKFSPNKPALSYVKCEKCGKRTKHEVVS